jgi:hypothetical protein
MYSIPYLTTFPLCYYAVPISIKYRSKYVGVCTENAHGIVRAIPSLRGGLDRIRDPRMHVGVMYTSAGKCAASWQRDAVKACESMLDVLIMDGGWGGGR